MFVSFGRGREPGRMMGGTITGSAIQNPARDASEIRRSHWLEMLRFGFKVMNKYVCVIM